MKNKDNQPDKATLRQKAEELLTTCKDAIHRISVTTDVSVSATESEKLKLIHELQVHQIELEMQNEELLVAKEKAEIAEEKYIELYDFAPSGYLTLSKEGKITELNFAAAHMLGKERLHLIDRNFALFISEKTRHTFALFFQNVISSKVKVSCEVMFVIESNSPIHLHVDGILSVNEEQLLLTMVDITERKLVEQRLEKTRQELEDLNNTKDKFFKIIAHDLRNPFIGISGLSEVMENILLENKTEEWNQLLQFTQMIHSSSVSSCNLLENLLQWTMSQTGKISVNPQNIPVNYLLSNTIQIVNGIAYKKNITIDSKIADNVIVYADVDLTNTVLRNLLTNAIKFTNHNSKIIVSTQKKDGFFDISVTDTGIGIDSSDLDKIFRIDSKIKSVGTDEEKGTGLGLILCKEFVEKQGGNIWATSELGKGTTLTFTLPIAR